jgi:hypothetical protein
LGAGCRTGSNPWDNFTTAWPKDLVLRNLSPSTACHYLLYGRKFAAFFGRSPTELGEAKICQYLLHSIEVEVELYPFRERRRCPLRRHAVTDSESLLGDGNRGGRANNGLARGIN